MRHMIEDYRSHPGEHCGSVAMRSLLEYYSGLELPEPVVFGLGAGLDCMCATLPGMGTVAFGRTATMEVDLAWALGVDYREQPEEDDEKAWQDVRAEVLAGRPTMLSGDIFYLDYRDYTVHFPAHRFVLLGFDDEREEVYIADRIRPEAETCSLGALKKSRNPDDAVSTHNLWGRFHDTRIEHDLVTAGRRALSRCTKRMLGEADPEASAPAKPIIGQAVGGVAGIARFADELPAMGELPNAAGVAGFNGSAIEKFGNGGGNFRRLYAGFLDWMRELDPASVPADASAIAIRAADGWTETARLLWRASEGESTWKEASAKVREIEGIERALFEGLAKSCPA